MKTMFLLVGMITAQAGTNTFTSGNLVVTAEKGKILAVTPITAPMKPLVIFTNVMKAKSFEPALPPSKVKTDVYKIPGFMSIGK